MSRIFRGWVAVALVFLATMASAQGFSGLARVAPEKSVIADARGGGIDLRLGLSQGVPYRLFTLPEPDRLVLDFREVDWSGLDPQAVAAAKGVGAVRFGGFRPGWSRMVVDLTQPMLVRLVDMRIDPETGAADLSVRLTRATREQFDAQSIPPHDPDWGVPPIAANRRKPDDGRTMVVIDPGHGGIDPGAERGAYKEKDLMLLLAFDLREALLRTDGVDVTLTREDDRFVSLERRLTIAHAAGADIFLSLHADALAEGRALGAVAYTLDEDASDEASALLAERHDRADMLAGIDLTGNDDVVADVLMDLARIETQPRTTALAQEIVRGLGKAGIPLNRRPSRRAAFSVLKSADVPSVLLEIGFISSDRDLKHIADPLWRRKAAGALRDAVQAWIIADKAARGLVRQ